MQLRSYPNGDIAGFDIPTLLSVARALRYDEQIVILLLDYAESGLREAIAKNGNSNAEHFDPNLGP